ncbi:MAG: amidohydrolase [Gemmatimonadota bacterium]|jgi:metal-dependent amidase/aminoacylase/carboxypeptidase family protein|nr:MAG: amidohydrolase [Gemmatimonadota bacterium]
MHDRFVWSTAAAAAMALLMLHGNRLDAQERNEADIDPVLDRMDRRLEAVADELVAVRRDIHRHPELSGEEERTAAIVSERLAKLGFDVRTGVGGHGVVGTIRGGAGPVVAYRADMDAVVSTAPDPVPFRSETPGVRHICGHDIHTTVGLGIAEALAAVRDELPGTVKLIFQPAEESIEGARAMIADGALDDPRPVAILALHTAPLEVGQIGVIEGMVLPGLDLVRIRLSGDGDLKAAAERYADAFGEVSTIGAPGPDLTIQGVPEFILAFLSGSERSGDDSWVLQGFVKASGEDQYRRAKSALLAELDGIEIEGVSAEVEYLDRILKDTINDQELLEAVAPTIRSRVGAAGLVVSRAPIPYFGEDFSFFQEEIPGALFWLGVSNSEKGTVGLPHSPDYVADEGSIQVGARTMAGVILVLLREGG